MFADVSPLRSNVSFGMGGEADFFHVELAVANDL